MSTQYSNLISVAAVLAIALVSATFLGTTAEAASPSRPAERAAVDRPDGDYVVDAEYDASGALVSVKAFLSDGTEVRVPADDRAKVPARLRAAPKAGGGATTNATGGGGAPGGTSGCRWVTVNNEVETALGFTLVWTRTYTS